MGHTLSRDETMIIRDLGGTQRKGAIEVVAPGASEAIVFLRAGSSDPDETMTHRDRPRGPTAALRAPRLACAIHPSGSYGRRGLRAVDYGDGLCVPPSTRVGQTANA